MTFSQSDYSLNIYRKKIDSYFEDPTIKELDTISFIIDALYPIFKYYSDELLTVDENVNFIFDFNDETKEVGLKSYFFHKYEYYFGQNKLKTEIKAIPDGDYLTLIDMVPMELPIFYTERKKLINPYVLIIYNEGCHTRKLYLIPEEKNKAYEKAIQIINANEIGSHLCITNALLHQAVKNMNNSLYNLTFEPLQYFRINDLSVIEYNFHNTFASKDHFFVDYDVLTEFFDNLNKCYDFIDENFDGESYDESLFESLNPDIYNFFIKYIANQDDDFILFENCLLSNQLFGNLYPYTELLKLEDQDSNNEENQNDDFELTDTTFAS